MQTQWSTGANEGDGGSGGGADPLPMDGPRVAGDAGADAVGIVPDAAPVTGTVAADAGGGADLRDDPADGTDRVNWAAPDAKSTWPVPLTDTEPAGVPVTDSLSEMLAVLAATVFW